MRGLLRAHLGGTVYPSIGDARPDTFAAAPTDLEVVTSFRNLCPFSGEGTSEMHDTRAVELTLELPADVAESVAEVARRDPDYVGRVIKHGLVRRAVFHELRRSGAFRSLSSETASNPSA